MHEIHYLLLASLTLERIGEKDGSKNLPVSERIYRPACSKDHTKQSLGNKYKWAINSTDAYDITKLLINPNKIENDKIEVNLAHTQTKT